ncbi:MAG: tRNA (adenosine(37)-N6)-threonylcarbamoyltransferase complex dimerization subunit type 1 TsaB [Rhodospirillales bacterium]|nr:tRNA (adenosine(37)-N6)-threonylcarbamoyltransferase complex dimerization subunit type 1 TsaB [Rhodospirillales bacterium]MCW8862091.1 tRNA (adenosine(37)-N6)-threonylcarbamoyltransferase complex dimerization subunit type 1 TsaB [Rhodospirillales bacterium]MCW8951678.1 tRNA (adenosine(37)-N6)-threonylcarbamoyltransferase complex dimerization subunit type 1 TsaB [Rhodospirillales bacterium]MCW9003122.1 tRNA (adenosine(37)-N6)-threonylcarbamoyltransferase complex dimerization subunit type 1 Tsa
MKILGIDTATTACSAALWSGEGVVARRFAVMARGQAEALMPMMRTVMDEGGVAFAELDAIAVTVGPGAFTGLRIGLAAARGLALSVDRPVIAITTMEAVAAGTEDAERAGRNVLVALDAKRSDVYAQLFDSGLKPIAPPEAILPERLTEALSSAPLLLVGDYAERLLPVLLAAGVDVVLSKASPHPDAAVVARLAAFRVSLEGLPGEDAPSAAPLYLRPPDATPAKNGGRLRPLAPNDP